MNIKIDCKNFFNNNSSNLTSEVEFKISVEQKTIDNNLPQILNDAFKYLSDNFEYNIKIKSRTRVNFCGKPFLYNSNNINIDIINFLLERSVI